MYEAKILKETEKAFLVEPLNFEYNEGDLFIPKTAVDNWIVAEWFCTKYRGLDGGITLLLPDGGVKGIEKIGMWDEDPAGNNGGAKVTNANLLSVPVKAIETEIEAEFGDDIDDLEDIGEGEPEPEMEEAAEQKDPFGEQAKKEIEKIKRAQGLTSKDEQPAQEEEVEDTRSTIPPEVEEAIEENAVLLEHTMRRGRKVVDNVFTDDELNETEKAEMAQDIGISLIINVKRGY